MSRIDLCFIDLGDVSCSYVYQFFRVNLIKTCTSVFSLTITKAAILGNPLAAFKRFEFQRVKTALFLS